MRRYATIMAVLLALSTLVTSARRAVVAAPSQRPDLQEALDALVDAGAPGVVAYVRDPAGSWAGASGLADLKGEREMHPDLRFRVASMTKPFVATVALQLVAEGRLGLDDPVERWLPGVVPSGEQITVRQLLGHTSGVPDYLAPLILPLMTSEEFRRRSWNAAELVVFGTAQPPTFPPGEGWSYSNTGYLLLGMIIEQVTGNPVREEVTRRLLAALGLDATSFPDDEPELGGDHARGYEIALAPGGEPLIEPLDVTTLNSSLAGAAGAMVATAEDLADFERALLSGALLPAELLAQMRTPVANAPAAAPYGLGLQWQDTACGPMVGHTGSIAGYVTLAFASEDASRQAVLLVNVGVFTPPSLGEPLRRTFVTVACGAPGTAGAADATPLGLLDAYR
jgi:D-alanyl-D-alanine carboxypeptidase